MDDLNKIIPLSTRRLVALVTFSFLLTFVVSRLVVYLVLGHLLPDFFLTVKGVHIHHFTYGVVILVVVGFYLLIFRPHSDSQALWNAAFVYGVGLGLTLCYGIIVSHGGTIEVESKLKRGSIFTVSLPVGKSLV